MKAFAFRRLALSAALAVACSGPDSAPREAAGGAWVELGVMADAHVRVEDGPGEPRGSGRARAAERGAAARAFTALPSEVTALRLARAYFPDLAPSERPAGAPALDATTALQVSLPERLGAPLEASTRGLRFVITPEGVEPGAQARLHPAAATYGPRHLWAAAGAAEQAGRRLLTGRVEEYAVAEGETYRAGFRLDLPPGIAGVREAGRALELSDGQGGPPVLRLHLPQARDAEGLVRLGVVRLGGVAAVDGAPGRFLARGSSVQVQLEVDLRGLVGPVVVDPGWSSTASMANPRGAHSATLLPSGQVLVAGGQDDVGYLTSAEVFDPSTLSWTATTSPLGAARALHTATPLPSGKVLLAGGWSGSAVASAELFDPSSGSFAPTGPPGVARSGATATLLPSGKVLIAGGRNTGLLDSAELYDPAAGTFSTVTATLSSPRQMHGATLLQNGKVLLAGGNGGGAVFGTAMLFDPLANTIVPTTGAMTTPRQTFTATLLPSGKVLLAGGFTGSVGTPSAELFDPATGTFSATTPMTDARSSHSATLLPNGKVLVAGGFNGTAVVSSTELYDPVPGTWTATAAPMVSVRENHQATILSNGRVLITGGYNDANIVASAELFDPGPQPWAAAVTPMSSSRNTGTATLLPSGKVLVVGGNSGPTVVAIAELYDPSTGKFTATTGPLPGPRGYHTATLLSSGKVLIAGGSADATSALDTALLYDPATDAFITLTARLTAARLLHTATLLQSGQVLLAGGANGPSLKSAELFDPVAGTFTATTGTMTTQREWHSATLLTSGKVLVAGGYTNNTTPALQSAELFDPSTGQFTLTAGLMVAARNWHTGTLLPSGKVLIAGGDTGTSAALQSAELFDPASGTFLSTSGAMTTPRERHTAVLLPSGRVLLTGGRGASPSAGLNSSELFDPVTRTFASAGVAMSTGRIHHTATLLTSSKVLVEGGMNNSTTLATAEVFDDSGAAQAWRPALAGPLALAPGATVTLTGTGLRGISAGSAGTSYDSPTDFPRVSLQAIDSGRWIPLAVSDFSATSATVTVPASTPIGRYVAWVTASGITGGRVVRVGANAAPVASAQSVSTREDAALPVTLGGTDADGDTLTFSVVTPPSGGVLSGTPPSLTYAPALNFAGGDSFTFMANDGTVDSAPVTISVTVTPVNDQPTLDVIGAATVLEDSTPTTVPLTGLGPGGGADEASQTVTVTALSANPALLPNPTVTGSGAPTALQLTPAANRAGTTTVNVIVQDNGGTVDGGVDTLVRQFSVSVTPVNDAPVLDAIADVTVLEDSASTPVTLTGLGPGGGPDEATQTLTVTATSSDPTVVPDPTVTGTGATRTLTFAPVANAAGNVVITVTVKDSGGTASGGVDTFTRTFAVTVTGVNDAPTFDTVADVTVAEDAASTGVTLTGVGPGGGLDEAAQTLTFTATSSDPTVVPDPTVTGSGATRTLSFAPVANANGAVVITVTAKDSGGTATGGVDVFTRTFGVTVTAVNCAPVFAGLADVSIQEDEPSPPVVTVTGLGPGGGADEVSQGVIVTASSSNPTLVPDPVVSGTGATRTLTWALVADAVGTAVITVTAKDDGGTGNGGVDTFSSTFTITVEPVNDPPTFAVIADQTLFKASGPHSVVITGVGSGGGADEASQVVTLTASSDKPALVPNPTVTGAGPSRTLAFELTANLTGTATVTVTANDDGGGADTFTRTFKVNVVSAKNQKPVANDGSFATDGEPIDIVLKATDGDGDPLTFQVATPPEHGTLSGDAPNLTYTPTKGFGGTDHFTFVANDGQEDSDPATIGITVNAQSGPVRSRYAWSGCSAVGTGPMLWALLALAVAGRRRVTAR